MNRVILFTSSPLALSVIITLVKMEVLGAVVVSPSFEDGVEKIIQTLQKNNIPVLYQPEKETNKFLKELRSLNGDLGLVFIYNKILQKDLYSLFVMGCFNIHPSPLPKYRGFHPLLWQILKEEKKSALTIHKITDEIDGGDIALSFEFDILESDTLGTLTEKISQIAPFLLESFFKKLKENSLEFSKQIHPTYNPKPSLKELTINWENDSSKTIHQKAKACNPHLNGVFTLIKNSHIGILVANPIENISKKHKAGEIFSIEKNRIIVATKDGFISLNLIYIEGMVVDGGKYAEVLELQEGDTFENFE